MSFGPTWSILVGEAQSRIADIPSGSVSCCVTSPPYWGQRVYAGCPSGLGLEETQEEYVGNLCDIFDGVRESLADNGTLWLNIGDGFFCKSSVNRNGATDHLGGKTRGGGEYKLPKRKSSHLKQKDLCGTPWAVAMELRGRGWYLRDAVIWNKPAPMPGGARDRCTSSYETIFMLTKSKRYKFNADAVAETGVTTETRSRRNVWTIASARGNGWHFALMPKAVAEICIAASSDEDGLVLDPFHGSGTTGKAAVEMGRRYVGIEACEEYAKNSEQEFLDEFQEWSAELPDLQRPAAG